MNRSSSLFCIAASSTKTGVIIYEDAPNHSITKCLVNIHEIDQRRLIVVSKNPSKDFPNVRYYDVPVNTIIESFKGQIEAILLTFNTPQEKAFLYENLNYIKKCVTKSCIVCIDFSVGDKNFKNQFDNFTKSLGITSNKRRKENYDEEGRPRCFMEYLITVPVIVSKPSSSPILTFKKSIVKKVTKNQDIQALMKRLDELEKMAELYVQIINLS